MGIGSMGSFYVGVSGLNANQNALNTTAHNITNVDTAGYTRQQVLMTSNAYQTMGRTPVMLNQIGIGTKIESVRQVRDRFLDQSYRNEVGRENYYATQYESVAEIEDYFGELEGQSFQTCISDLWGSISELKKETNSIVTRGSLVQTADALIERANNIHTQLVNYQLNLNQKIIDQVDRVNELANEIYKYNQEIVKVEVGGTESANDYRDKRNQAIDELSGILSVEISEDSMGNVEVKAEGKVLVSGDSVYEMGTRKISETSDLLVPTWDDYGGIDVYNFDILPSSDAGTDIGSMKGVIMARGNATANYTDIPVKPYDTQPSPVDFASNEEYVEALGKWNEYLNKTNYYNIYIEPYAVTNLMAEFDQLIHGMVTMVNDTLCPNDTVENLGATDLIGKTYRDQRGKEITIDKNTLILDESTATIGMGEGNDFPGTELFSRSNTTRYTSVTITDASGNEKTYKVYNPENINDNYSLYTLGEIEVNPDVKKNYSLIPLSTKDGGEALETVDTLLQNWSDDFAVLNPNSLLKHNYNNYYSAMIGELATKGSTFSGIADNQKKLANDVDNQRQEVSGASSDEELTNLIKYQHAYNASSRYVNVVSQMLEHLIEKLG